MAREHGASTGWHLIASPLGTVQAATFNYTRPIGTTIGEPAGLINVNFDPRTLDTYAWKIDEPITRCSARGRSNIRPSTAPIKATVCRRATSRRHRATPASLPQLQPVSAPAVAVAAAPRHAAGRDAAASAKAEQHADSDVAAPLVVQTDIHHDVSTAMAPAVGAMPTDDLSRS